MLNGLLVLVGGWLASAAPTAAPAPSPSRPPPLLARPPAAPAAVTPPFLWKVPGLVSQLDVPGEMNVGGMPIRLEVYTSSERVETLLQSFVNAATAAGFYIPRVTKRVARQPHLTALDTRSLTAYTIILNPAPGGHTTVVFGEARMEKGASAAPSLLPPYPEAKQVLTGHFEGAETVSFWAAARPEQVAAWYRERLLTAGYKEEGPLVFRRREQEVRLSLKSERLGTAALLFITVGGEGSTLSGAP